MPTTRSFGRTVLARVAPLVWGVGLLLAAAPLRAEIARAALTRGQIETASASTSVALPAGQFEARVARVWLRFEDAPLVPRGGNAWSYTVRFALRSGGASAPPQASALTIYRATDHDVFESVTVLDPLPGGSARVDVTAVESTDFAAVPPNVRLVLEVEGRRVVPFAPAVKPTLALESGSQKVVTLPLVSGAVEYDFEWVYVDSREPTPAKPFEVREPTRITTSEPSVRLDLSYPAGALHVRVRAVGRHAATTDVPEGARRPGAWSNAILLSISPTGARRPVEPDKNWHYLSSYGEGPDAVSALSFFDGALRHRQGQKQVASEGFRLVTETKYDAEGRPSVNFLQAPAPDPDYRFEAAFNSLDAPAGNVPYDTLAFDGRAPPPASASSGAGNYYSARTSAAFPADAYVPDAQGYPFSVAEHTREGSGRLRRSAGFGRALTIDSGHEVSFLYGNASSSILRGLFGRDAGRADFYERNLEVDPNRVARVAYVDPEGKVIASALTGDAPPNLESVAPPPSPPVTFRLDENNQLDALAGRSRSVNRVVNEAPSDLFFEYDLTGVEYSVDPEDPRFPPLCASCRYRLGVRITGPNGQRVPLLVGSTRTTDADCSCPSQDGVPTCTATVTELEAELANPTPASCSATDTTSTFAARPAVRFCAKFTEPGEYEVVKELTFVDGAIDALFEDFVATPGFFDIDGYRPPGNDFDAQCGPDCEAFCREATADDPAAFPQCIESCENPQEWAIPEAVEESCNGLEQLIETDLAEGGILEGEAAHPEACHVAVCREQKASSIFDARMTAEDSYTEALCKGYVDPLGAVPGSPALPVGCVPERDPFFQPGGLGAPRRTWMRGVMEDFTGTMPGFPAEASGLSIWEYAADPDLDGLNTLSGDSLWRMVRSLYMGAKQRALVTRLEDADGRNCPYWDDPRAHVQRPHTFDTAEEALDAAADATSEYCEDLCPLRVDQWLYEIDAACGPVPEPVRGRVRRKLLDYCANACGLSNPLAVLTKEAVRGEPLLREVQALLPGGCSLDGIAVEDRYVKQRICRTTCCVDGAPTECGRLALRLLRETLPRAAGDLRDLSDDPTGDQFRRGCIDWVVFISVERDRVVLSSKDRQRQCSIRLVDSAGEVVDPSALVVTGGPFVAAVPPGLPAAEYTGIALEVGDGSARRLLYLYSDCGLDWVDEDQRNCGTPPVTSCPPLPKDPKKPEAREDAKACQDDVRADSSRMAWPAPKTGERRGRSSRGDRRSGREFLPIPDSQRQLACRPCLQELLARLVRARRDEGPAGKCFESVKPGEKEWGAQPSGSRVPRCRVRLYDSSGRPLDPSQVLEIAAEMGAPPPAGIDAADRDGLPYAGISLQVRTSSGWQTAYLFSDCSFPAIPDCDRDCGIAIAVDPCLREALDAIDPRRRGEDAKKTRCARKVTVTRDRIMVVRRDGDRSSTCSVVLIGSDGRPIRLQGAVGVVGEPRLAESPRGDSIAGRLDYAGLAVTVRITSADGRTVDVEAFVYTDCGFRAKEDCEDVVVDWPIKPPPPGDPDEACRRAVEDLADQQGNVALDRALGEFETFLREVHHNRCFGSGLRESFRYSTVPREYHYTLHYYDQAKNLVQTVPPAGVRRLSDALVTALEGGGNIADPEHVLASQYRYNSLNQIIWQQTPDAGWKRFWYDAAGQLRFSRTAQQQADGKHAYLKYDRRGRVVESGLVSALSDAQLQSLVDSQDFPGEAQARVERVVTEYDRPGAPECHLLEPTNLRGRVASVRADSSAGALVTCYSYDPHGTITSLLQVLPGLPPKRIDYDYDVIDGKVRAVHYQAGEPDALHHRHVYDADRRLAAVETSRDGLLWDRDGTYSYYRHGPLARLVLGADAVQGVDYLYAIAGWPKGVNADTLDSNRDPGRDGAATGPNTTVPRDVFATAIHYFPDDYSPVGAPALGGTAGLPQSSLVTTPAGGAMASSALFAAACWGAPGSTGCGLYDGNVTATVNSFGHLGSGPGSILGTAYRYDQLYRLRNARSFGDVESSANRWPSTSSDPNLWRTEMSYDANGNITQVKRHAKNASGVDPPGRWMDQLTYRYGLDAQGRPTSNRLLHVNDSEPASSFLADLDDQGPFSPSNPQTHNYAYDLSGRPVRDRAAGHETIRWNAADRVSEIRRSGDAIEFLYDGLGRRVVKLTKPSADPSTWRHEYFVRDENGEIRATYDRRHAPDAAGAEVALEEHTIVGAGRIGVAKAGADEQPPPGPGESVSLARFARLRGAKLYELNNHLGNVYATVSDRKKPVLSGGTVTHYEAQVSTANDYEAFGSLLEGRSDGSPLYRFGFSGLERDDDLKGPGNSYYTHARLYDPRVGRWLSPDPVELAGISPYVGFSNNPLRYRDPSGQVDWDAVKDVASNAGQTYVDMYKDLGRMGVGIVEGRIESLKKAKAAYKEGELTEAAGWAVGVNGTLESLAEKTVEWEDEGASTDEIVGLAVGEVSGMNQFMEGVTGDTLQGDPLTEAERWERGIVGATQVIGTAGSVAGGVSTIVKPKGGGVKPPAPKPGTRALSCSFSPDTLVLAEEGPVPISEIEDGDLVVSRDERTGEIGFQPVLVAYSSVHESSVVLEFPHPSGETERLVTTPEHPFWVQGRGWTEAGSIQAGETVSIASGWLRVGTATFVQKELVTYNLDVAEWDTFFVGESEAWVHNCKVTYQTYTKVKIQNGKKIVYVGRTKGTGTPKQNVARRDAGHHMSQKGFGPAKVDKSSSSYEAIRGREQRRIDKAGGAQSEGGTSGNTIRGISLKNKKIKVYLKASDKKFGKP